VTPVVPSGGLEDVHGPELPEGSAAWIAIIAVVFALSPNELVLWTMLALALALGAYWRVSARSRFPGPHAAATRARRPPPDRCRESSLGRRIAAS
jgi:hypothetical protein